MWLTIKPKSEMTTKTRNQKEDKRQALRLRKAKDYVRCWMYSGTSFERLNPNE